MFHSTRTTGSVPASARCECARAPCTCALCIGPVRASCLCMRPARAPCECVAARRPPPASLVRVPCRHIAGARIAPKSCAPRHPHAHRPLFLTKLREREFDCEVLTLSKLRFEWGSVMCRAFSKPPSTIYTNRQQSELHRQRFTAGRWENLLGSAAGARGVFDAGCFIAPELRVGHKIVT